MDNLGGLTRVLISRKSRESERSRGWGWRRRVLQVLKLKEGATDQKKPGGLRH